jgi:hypothetical protein
VWRVGVGVSAGAEALGRPVSAPTAPPANTPSQPRHAQHNQTQLTAPKLSTKSGSRSVAFMANEAMATFLIVSHSAVPSTNLVSAARTP